MLLLILYVSVALGFSFLCSIAEAVLLSVTTAHIALLEQDGRPAGRLLRDLKDDVDRPLAAILTLNTVAHTVGAAGAGAQAAAVFGKAWVGAASAVLTLLILVFSEIIPKTLGALHWRRLAPATAHTLRLLIRILYPFVLLAERITRRLAHDPTLRGASRRELAAMAALGVAEGQIASRESRIITNLLLLRETRVTDAMTPRPVVFSLAQDSSVADYFEDHGRQRFSRIPLYRDDPDRVVGFVLRADLLLAQARGNGDNPLAGYCRELAALPDGIDLLRAFDEFLERRDHIKLIVDEYGNPRGILTLEDVIETLLDFEIVDEGDRVEDMQAYARRLWYRRARAMGLELDDEPQGPTSTGLDRPRRVGPGSGE